MNQLKIWLKSSVAHKILVSFGKVIKTVSAFYICTLICLRYSGSNSNINDIVFEKRGPSVEFRAFLMFIHKQPTFRIYYLYCNIAIGFC